MYTLYTAEKELLTLHQNNKINVTKLKYWPNEVFHKLETRIHLLIQLTPTLQSELQKREQIPNSCGKLVRKYAIRKTYLLLPPPPPTGPHPSRLPTLQHNKLNCTNNFGH